VSTEQIAGVSTRPGFSGYLADTRESRRIHYRIRYQVYCERKGFEDNALLRKRGLERDAYDGHALPFIMRDDHDGQWRGTARLVIRGTTHLPMENTSALPPRFCEGYGAGRLAEVSRLAALTPPSLPGRDRWSLLKATLGSILTCAEQFGLEDVLFLITVGLARVVQRLGIPMTAVGTPVHHRGERQAFLSAVTDALNSLREAGVQPDYGLYSSADQDPAGRLLA